MQSTKSADEVYLLTGTKLNPRRRFLVYMRYIADFIRGDMDEEELLVLDRLGLAPAPELYFGRGFA